MKDIKEVKLHITKIRKYQSDFSDLDDIYSDDEIYIICLNKRIEELSKSTDRGDIAKRLVLEEELAAIEARLMDKQSTICEYFGDREGGNDES